MPAAISIWWRSDLRQRWRTVIALVLFCGLAAAVPIAALAGARRADTAFARGEEVGLAPDATIERGGGEVPEGALAEALALPHIEVSTVFDLLLMRPVGTDYFFAFEFFVFGARDPRLGTDIGVTNVVDGRERDPGAEDEVIIDEVAADVLGLAVGDTLSLESWTNEARDATFAAEDGSVADPDGPVVDLTVVGVYVNQQSLTEDDTPPQITTTPAFHARYVGDDPDQPTEIGNFPGIALVRLADGFTLDDLETALEPIAAAHDLPDGVTIPVDRLLEGDEEQSDEKNAQVLALQLFAAVSAAAGLFVVGQALSRHLFGLRPFTDILRAVGGRRRTRVATYIAGGAPVAAGGAVVAVVVAWLLSSLLPIGTPGRAEVNPGRAIHFGIVGAGAAATALAFLGWSAVVGWLFTRHPGRDPRPRASTVVRGLARIGLPVAATTGVRMAVDPGRGRAAVPVRPALAGAVVGLAGVTGALVFTASLDHLLESPELYGWEVDAYAVVGPFEARDVYDDVLASLQADDQVARVGGELDVVLKAGPGAPREFVDGTAVDLATSPPLHTLVAGRYPEADDEISLGPLLADQWGVGIGDAVTFERRTGGLMEFEVVGLDIQPQNDFDGYNHTFTMPLSAAEQIEPVPDFDGEWAFAVDFSAGAEEQGIAGLHERGFFVVDRFEQNPIASLEEVDVFPLALAGFLALLALGFLLHALVAAVRIRRRDLAVYKTIGFRRRQVAAAVEWQAATIVVVGLIFGLGLGVVVGRRAYQLLTAAVDVRTEVVVPVLVPLVAVAALGVGAALAIGPALRAAATRPAETLRAE